MNGQCIVLRGVRDDTSLLCKENTIIFTDNGNVVIDYEELLRAIKEYNSEKYGYRID